MKVMTENIVDDLVSLMTDRPQYLELLKLLIKLDDEDPLGKSESGWKADSPTGRGWEWGDDAMPNTNMLNKLRSMGIVHKWGSNKTKMYCLLHRKEVEEAIKIFELPDEDEKAMEIVIPDDLFDVIEGYDDLKKWFRKSLEADKPVHYLLLGVPASAKSLFLLELERIQSAVFVSGTGTSGAGIEDTLIEKKPFILLYDEIDKIKSKTDIGTLLSVMGNARLTVRKRNRVYDEKCNARVFATANNLRGMSKEMISRFGGHPIVFRKYSDDEFVDICTKVLIKREGKSHDIAKYIANGVMRKLNSKDVRTAIKVARMCNTKDEVDDFIKTLGMHM